MANQDLHGWKDERQRIGAMGAKRAIHGVRTMGSSGDVADADVRLRPSFGFVVRLRIFPFPSTTRFPWRPCMRRSNAVHRPVGVHEDTDRTLVRPCRARCVLVPTIGPNSFIRSAPRLPAHATDGGASFEPSP